MLAGASPLHAQQSDHQETLKQYVSDLQKKPNAFGLYDMYGNVSEWCSDMIGAYPMMRGGRWLDYASECDSTYYYAGSGGGNDRGFRCVSSK